MPGVELKANDAKAFPEIKRRSVLTSSSGSTARPGWVIETCTCRARETSGVSSNVPANDAHPGCTPQCAASAGWRI